jgi:hypothetical protein
MERLSARMGAVAEKIAAADRTASVSKRISETVPLMQSAIRRMNDIGVLTRIC